MSRESRFIQAIGKKRSGALLKRESRTDGKSPQPPTPFMRESTLLFRTHIVKQDRSWIFPDNFLRGILF